jgi:hypothetical protein
MYVNRYRADASEFEWTPSGGGTSQIEPVMGIAAVEGAAFRIGRSEISMHNTSAPDLRFSEFATAP